MGYTLVDLALRYPKAMIVGYEMEEEKFFLAKKNIEGLRHCEINHCAVAGTSGTFSMIRIAPVTPSPFEKRTTPSPVPPSPPSPSKMSWLPMVGTESTT